MMAAPKYLQRDDNSCSLCLPVAARRAGGSRKKRTAHRTFESNDSIHVHVVYTTIDGMCLQYSACSPVF